MAAALVDLLVALLAILFVAGSALKIRTAVENRRRTSGGRNIPPGAAGWPLVGETFAFLKTSLVGHRGEFMELHTSRFGKIFSANVMGRSMIISIDPEANRSALSINESMGPGWPSSTRRIFGGSAINFLSGDEHKRMRSVVLGFLGAERLRTLFLRDAERAAAAVFDSWVDGSVVLARHEATKFSFNIMVKETMNVSPEEPEFREMMRSYEPLVKGVLSIPIDFPGTTFSRALRARKNILRVIDRGIEERRKKRGSSSNGGSGDVGGGEGKKKMGISGGDDEEGDLLSWLMKNTSYSREVIGDLLLFTLFAGHDTTSRSISLMIFFLLGCPAAIVQLREENLQVLASKERDGQKQMQPLTWEDYKNMKFSNCVINETLRLGSVVKLIMRKVSSDVQVKGFVIPKGSTFLAHLPATHLDPSHFDNPNDFDPWRWLEIPAKNSGFMPFGWGARMCPGADLARLEMMVFLHRLVLGFEWEATETDVPLYSPSVTFPKGLPIKIRRLHVVH